VWTLVNVRRVHVETRSDHEIRDGDKFVNRELRKLGWKVVRVWGHELREPMKVAVKVRRVYET